MSPAAMGGMLEKPLMSTVVERHSGKRFSVAVAELNGYRMNMEDAHVIHMEETWGAFGVFDGHGGDQCSKWVAKRFVDEFAKNGCPQDDDTVKELFLKVDREFLDSGQPSGTTATMCIIHAPTTEGGKFKLRVINAGDSRVLLGVRSTEAIVDGGGTDQGLTIDHKPNHPSEKKRIEANGGKVEMAAGGVARLNGDLAVSRGFGDAEYKKQGPDPNDLERQPSTASPEMGTFECDESDFVLLVCDGVSEGDFSNAEVVKEVAGFLKKGQLGDTDTGAAAAVAVCKKAVATNSKDNVTCMVVQCNGGATLGICSKEFNAGPISCPGQNGFIKAYEEMARRGDLTLAEAMEKRYEQIKAKGPERSGGEKEEDDNDLELIGEPSGEKGSDERREFFAAAADRLKSRSDSGESAGPLGAINNIPPQILAALIGGGGGRDADGP